jgi:hypothetical protein
MRAPYENFVLVVRPHGGPVRGARQKKTGWLSTLVIDHFGDVKLTVTNIFTSTGTQLSSVGVNSH